jgi:hypothetical protein
MFEDVRETVNSYIKLKKQLNRVEAFLKESLKNKLNTANQEDILETIISLLGSQRSIEDIKLEEAINKSDAKEFNQN